MDKSHYIREFSIKLEDLSEAFCDGIIDRQEMNDSFERYLDQLEKESEDLEVIDVDDMF